MEGPRSKPTKKDAAAWLGGKDLGGPQREQILETVLNRLADEGQLASPRRARWHAWAAVGAVVAAALVLLVPRRGPPPPESVPSSEGSARFAARGEPGVAASLELVCQGATLEACPIGATLVFAASGGARGHLVAYAEPMDAAGERIWYFSGDSSPALPPGVGLRPFPRAAKVGPEHRPGRHRVHAFVVGKPMSRVEFAALERTPRAADWLARATFLVTVRP